MNSIALTQANAVIPIVMSVAALVTALAHMMISGTAPQVDEGVTAHIWQLLMAGQLPFVISYSVNCHPRSPGTALSVLAMPIGAALAAAGPVNWLGW